MTVRELLQRIDSRELTEWMLFYEMEPWGCEVDDHRFGMVSATIANTRRDPKKRAKSYEPEDFFPPRSIGDEDIQEHGDKWRAFIAPFKKRK